MRAAFPATGERHDGMTTTRRMAGLRGHRLKRPDRTTLGAAAPVALALAVLAVAASPALQRRLDWVPVHSDNSVLDALLTVSLAIVFMIVAAIAVLPLSLVIHQAGHAIGGRLIGRRVLAVRVGPALVEPSSATGVFTRLPLRRRDDLVVAWTHLDDSPLPAWKRPRGWLVVLAAGPALNLAVSFVCAMWSIVAGPVGYVLLRQMVWINLAVCVATLLPIACGGIESDGRRLWTLLMDRDDADALLDRLRNEIVVGPTRPAAWPRERLEAWETAIRRRPAAAEDREEQLELAVYLMVHALDRGDRDAAWQWSQALQALLGSETGPESVAGDLTRVVLALHAARWDQQVDTARRHLDRIAAGSDILHSPWYMVARAAVLLGESASATLEQVDLLGTARSLAEGATLALAEPAKLHGVDQLMRGHAQAVAGDAEVELRRLAYDAAETEAA